MSPKPFPRADVNAATIMFYRPLHWAASYGHVGVVEELIRHGVDLEARVYAE